MSRNRPRSYLIRTTELQIIGPYTADRLRRLINKGSIKPNDEICGHLGSWIKMDRSERLQHNYRPAYEAIVASQNNWFKQENTGADHDRRRPLRFRIGHIVAMLIFCCGLAAIFYGLTQLQ